MKTWAQLLIPVPSISLFGFIIATIEKRVWRDDFGLLGKQSDVSVTTRTIIKNIQVCDIKKSSIVNKQGEKGQGGESTHKIKNEQCDFPKVV